MVALTPVPLLPPPFSCSGPVNNPLKSVAIPLSEGNIVELASAANDCGSLTIGRPESDVMNGAVGPSKPRLANGALTVLAAEVGMAIAPPPSFVAPAPLCSFDDRPFVVAVLTVGD